MAQDNVQVELNSLGEQQYVVGTYSLMNPQVRSASNGKPFLTCMLRDATGEVHGICFNFDAARLPAMKDAGFVEIEGETDRYNGKLQLKIQSIGAASLTEEQMRQLMPSTVHDTDEMYDRIVELLGSIEDPGLRSLADAYLADKELMNRFRQAPAAMSMHHAWIGGLLEHTHQLMTLADAMLPLYRGELNRDLVLVGLFIHDLAKTVELSWDKGFDYTTEGNFVGHITRGAIWLDEKVAELEPKLPQATFGVLMNILLSHHFEPEFGAAKPPATPEAVFVAKLDDLDAKTQMALSALQGSNIESGEFTDRLWGLNNARMYRLDASKQAAVPVDETAVDATHGAAGNLFNE